MYDDGRAGLPKDLHLGEANLRLVVTTPAEPGDYLLELDMIQESVSWFKNRGSETAKLRWVVPFPGELGRAAISVQKGAGVTARLRGSSE